MTPSDTSRAPAFPPGAIVRYLSELPPIQEPTMQTAYPHCQPRTPIDPVTAIKAAGLQKSNTDLQPAAWNPPSWVKPIIGAAE